MNFSKGYTFGATETVTNAKLHALVDNASASGIMDADIASDAAISSSKINFTLSDYVTLAGSQTITGAKTFGTTTTFSVPLANTNIAPIATASYVSGLSFYNLASCTSGVGKLPIANVPDIDSLLPSQSGHDGEFLKTDGSNASWGALSSHTYSADESAIIASALTEKTTNSTTYTKAKEITLVGAGTLYFTWYYKVNSQTGYVRIYRNDVAVGTEKTTSSTDYVSETDTISGWSDGDKIQVYYKSNSGGVNQVYIKDFKIFGTVCTIDVN